LREEARFHDGRPVTVEDVIWSFQALFEQGAPFYRFYYANVADVSRTGPRSVKFTFKPGENRELPLIVGQLPVLPRHYWADRDFGTTTLEPPVGSGPYRIGSFEPGRYIVYQRVPDHWGRKVATQIGRHNFDKIRFDYFRDDDVAIEGFKGGAFDFRLESNSKKWATAYDVPEVRDGRIVREAVPNERPQGMQGFAFNLRREIFSDPRVRFALAHAFDFEWSNKTLFYGQYTRTRSYFSNSELAAVGLPGPDERALLSPFRGRVPEEVFTREYEPPSSDGSGNLRANLKRAVELLREAGWVARDGVLTHAESGRAMEFEILLAQPAFERVALPFAKNLERIGIAASVRTVDTSQYRRRLDSFDFDMMVISIGQSKSPGNEQREFWGSESAGREGSRNVIGVRDPVVDELVELLIAAPDRASLVTRTRALDRVLQWSHYLIPNWHITTDRILHWDKYGRPAVVPPDGVQIDAWWYDPARAARLERGAGSSS
jgi:microcin C transport system substrate-binding protein